MNSEKSARPLCTEYAEATTSCRIMYRNGLRTRTQRAIHTTNQRGMDSSTRSNNICSPPATAARSTGTQRIHARIIESEPEAKESGFTGSDSEDQDSEGEYCPSHDDYDDSTTERRPIVHSVVERPLRIRKPTPSSWSLEPETVANIPLPGKPSHDPFLEGWDSESELHAVLGGLTTPFSSRRSSVIALKPRDIPMMKMIFTTAAPEFGGVPG